jgi:uncharacterized protein (TIGR02147 family)
MSSVKEIIANIFSYDNYRLFLRDYFEARKRESPYFSYRMFARRAGFSAHNFCGYVVSGARNISVRSTDKIIHAIGLKRKAATYFTNLVLYNQASTMRERDQYFERIVHLKPTAHLNNVEKQQWVFYEKWYYPVIRELAVISDWDGDYAKLGSMTRPEISSRKARDAIEKLTEIGMLEKTETGAYRLVTPNVSSRNVPAHIKRCARRDVLLHGIEAAETLPPNQRYTAYTTMTATKVDCERIKQVLDEAREKIIEIVSGEEVESDQEVYQLVLQLFPASKATSKKKSQRRKK